MKTNNYVQDYIPVKNISNGIIETTDNRFIKILEIEPINFLLRSTEEQANIIQSFANWLKIAPVKLQFKSMTSKADSNQYIEHIQEELKDESKECKELGEDYIKLIKDVGNKEALSRRFFLIFEYEQPRRTIQDYPIIVAELENIAENAKSYFSKCGNMILEHSDKDSAIAEILYTFFNRRTCIWEPLSSRVMRVVMDQMQYENKVFGKDEVPEIPTVNFIAPRGIDFTSPSYIVMDGMYYSYLYIKSNGFPGTVQGGWISLLVNAGDGVDVDIHLVRQGHGKSVDKVARHIRLNRSKLRDAQDTNADYEEINNSINAGYYIKQGLANNEDLFYVSVFITVYARTKAELNWKKHQVIDMLKAVDILVSECKFQQEDAFKAVMPLLSVPQVLERKAHRNVLTSGASSMYMFTSFEMSDDGGVLLGINKHNNSLCIIDLFNTKKHKNANMNIIGTSGAGKTFTMQLLALRMRMRGIQSFILAPIKGHEFKRACNNIGGSFIKIAPGSSSCINIMEIRHTVSPEIELLDDIGENEGDSVLAQKIQQLLAFFSLLIPDLKDEEEQLIDDALIKTYSDFGITHDNKSIYEVYDEDNPTMKKMPILGDLYNNLIEVKGAKRISTILSRFVTGSAQSFNQQTNVDLSNKYIVFDLSELKGKLLPVGMMIALDFVWDTIKSDRTQKKAIFIDEIWQLIGASSNKYAADFCLTIFKTIRGFGGAAISATQDLTDFFGLDDGKYGRAIINNSQNKIILNLEPDEAKYVQDVLKLTNSEISSITNFERGEALICSNSNKIPISIKASKKEEELITTDRAELAEIIKKRKGNDMK